MPRGRPALDATNEYLGKESPVTIGEIGTEREIIDKPFTASKAEREAFMNEILTVVVQSSGDENDADIVQVGVNGVTQFFKRDVAQQVKRKYVGVLARAKKTDYQQKLDDRLGESMNTLSKRRMLKYPFQVIHDPNPKGPEWLRHALAEVQ